MNLSDWAHLAEIVGTFALVISLGFVGFQISDNTKGIRALTVHNITTSLQTWYNSMGGNEQSAHVFRKGMNDPSSLSKDEKVQFIMALHSISLAYQEGYFTALDGSLDEALYTALRETIKEAIPAPGFSWYWKQRRKYFSPEYRDFVDKIATNNIEDAAEIYQ